MDPVTLILDDRPGRRERILRAIEKLPIKDGQVWDVIIGEHIARRTNSQNARLWLLHTMAAKHVGCSADDMHEDMLSNHFGYTEVKMPSGVIRRIPLKRSSTRNKREFREFMDYVESFYISELGCILGDPQ